MRTFTKIWLSSLLLRSQQMGMSRMESHAMGNSIRSSVPWRFLIFLCKTCVGVLLLIRQTSPEPQTPPSMDLVKWVELEIWDWKFWSKRVVFFFLEKKRGEGKEKTSTWLLSLKCFFRWAEPVDEYIRPKITAGCNTFIVAKGDRYGYTGRSFYGRWKRGSFNARGLDYVFHSISTKLGSRCNSSRYVYIESYLNYIQMSTA